ncbi:hypothetical protein MKX01_039762, partial [Papaver californicum]
YTGRIDKRGKQEPLGRKTRVSLWKPKLDILALKPYIFVYFGSLLPAITVELQRWSIAKLEMITDGINWWRLVLAVL